MRRAESTRSGAARRSAHPASITGTALRAAWLTATSLALASPALAGDAPPIEGPAELHAEAERAREALGPLKQGLMGALKGALAESPTAAVDTCKLAAPSITEGAARPGVKVGRTSNRLRNPGNAPEPWMKPLLAELEQRPKSPGLGRVVALAGGRVGYVEPIYLQPMCTTCHGKAIDPALLTHIRERYPQDRAVGYEPGELRGLFWVKLEAGDGAASDRPGPD